MIRFKSGVRLPQLRPQTVFAIVCADQVYVACGIAEMWITSINDSRHMPGSKHFSGYAFDLRTNSLPGGSQGDKAKEIHEKLEARLGAEFDVILEDDHIHVEYDPA